MGDPGNLGPVGVPGPRGEVGLAGKPVMNASVVKY